MPLLSSLRATLKINGSSTTRPTSKNIGMPTTNAAKAMAQGSMLSDDRLRMESAIASVTPESARILPSMAPSAMTIPTTPRVWPAPATVAPAIEPISIPAAMPTARETTSNAINGCSRMRVTMSATSNATPPSAVSSSWISDSDNSFLSLPRFALAAY